jgi:hypothetical protein
VTPGSKGKSILSQSAWSLSIAFQAYVEQFLVPELKPGDIVIMDNLGSHKGAPVRSAIEAAAARLLYLPPCSPDFDPIENAFAKLKTLLRNEPSTAVGTLSAQSSEPSPQPNAQTTSPPPDTVQRDWILL